MAEEKKKEQSFGEDIFGKLQEAFRSGKESYEQFVRRKEAERKIPDEQKVKHYPTVKEIAVGKTLLTKQKVADAGKPKKKKLGDEWLKVGVPGFDELLGKGVPKSVSILVAGGPGSGKTIFCLQTLAHAAERGEKCLYVSFEESEDRLVSHMEGFGWDPEKLQESGNLMIKRLDPFKISRSVEGLLAKARGELLIDMDEIPELIPEGFRPDRIVLDSLTALAAAFVEREEGYRIYIEQLFRYFERMGLTSFLISETQQVPMKFSKSGVEEFLADGVFVFYNLRKGNVRQMAVEVLKLRGAEHQKKIVPMQIQSGKGITVFPDQEVFEEIS